MSLCWNCWRTFESGDVNQHLCEWCRRQQKLFMYMEDDETGPKGTEVKE